MEKDDEISGSGNSYTAEYWQYDSRLGRRMSVDPVTQEWQTPYSSMDGNPIIYLDPLGDKIRLFSKKLKSDESGYVDDKEGKEQKTNDFLEIVNNSQEGVVFKTKGKNLVLDKDKTTVDEKDYNESTKKIMEAINAKHNIDISLVRGDRFTLFDSYLLTTMDLTDFDKLDDLGEYANAFKLTIVGHFLTERLQNPKYSIYEGRVNALKKFGGTHKMASLAATTILNDYLKLGFPMVSPSKFSATRDASGSKVVYHNTVDYGYGVKLKFETGERTLTGSTRKEQDGNISKVSVTGVK